jgi:cell division protein FtsQ
MDGRGRLAQPLTWIARLRARPPTADRRVGSRIHSGFPHPSLARLARFVRRGFNVILRIRVPRGAGLAAALSVVIAAISYGIIRGDHAPWIIAALKDARDEAANSAGFRLVALRLSGNHHLSREEILAASGVTGRTSVLFLDVEDTRARLRTNPWIADATVLKLYPGELQIGITEREPFAVWQREGRFFVIADDGMVLEPFVAPSLVQLPLVVGASAEKNAKGFLALLQSYPEIRNQVRASVMVAERRWNLRLRNGLDVLLPELDVAQALNRLAKLDRELKLTSRDISIIDLRLADRLTVRLSPAAAQARAESLKEKKPAAKKDGNA